MAHFLASSKPTRSTLAKVKLGRRMSPINYVGKSRHFASDIFSGLLRRDLSTGLFADLRQPTCHDPLRFIASASGDQNASS
jgi:hypothetical protein